MDLNNKNVSNSYNNFGNGYTPITLFCDGTSAIAVVKGTEKSITQDDVRNFFSVMDLCNASGISGIYITNEVPELVACYAADAARRRGIKIFDTLPTAA